MAQVISKISIKKTASPALAPEVGFLDQGELAINYRDGKLFYKDHNNVIQTISALEGVLTGAQVTKLDGIAAGATINSTDAQLRDRSTHTGTQATSTISGFDAAISGNADVFANTTARHAAVSVLDSDEIDFGLTGQEITASLKTGSIDVLKLDSGVQASLGLADTALQSVGSMTLDNLSDTTITSNTSGEILKWNGSAWINNTLAEAGIAAAAVITNYYVPQTLNNSSSVTFNITNGVQARMTLVDDATITLSNLADGQTASISGKVSTGGPYTVSVAHSGLTVRVMSGALADIAALGTNDLFELVFKRDDTTLRVWVTTLNL